MRPRSHSRRNVSPMRSSASSRIVHPSPSHRATNHLAQNCRAESRNMDVNEFINLYILYIYSKSDKMAFARHPSKRSAPICSHNFPSRPPLSAPCSRPRLRAVRLIVHPSSMKSRLPFGTERLASETGYTGADAKQDRKAIPKPGTLSPTSLESGEKIAVNWLQPARGVARDRRRETITSDLWRISARRGAEFHVERQADRENGWIGNVSLSSFRCPAN